MLYDMLNDYLDGIETLIRSLKNCHVEKYEEEILSANRANLRIRIRFLEGQLLEINEAVFIENKEPHHLAYRYHFQDKNNQLIFRFDNTPHFPNIETFPDHKHLPNKIEASEKPSISEVLDYVKRNI